MVMLVIQTQVYENYGAHDWDGTGECPQYWKPKGGSAYKVLDIPLNIDYNNLVSFALSGIEQDNEGYRETMIGWTIESDDYLSWFEKSQMEYDGVIAYPEPTMTYEQVMEKQKELACL
jgi:hypothetical protein